MKKAFKSWIIVISALTFSSCAVHNGYMNNSASLSQANFDYTQVSISGTASTLHVLGIGGLDKSAIVEEAKKDMLKKNPLKRNQALANITVNWKTGFFIIVITNECTVTADVVEFGPLQTDFPQLKSNNLTSEVNATESNKAEINTYKPFMVGDKVKIIKYFNKPVDGKVIAIQNDNYIVEYTKSNNKTKQVKVLGFQLEKIE